MPIHGREDNCHCGKLGCVELYGAGIRLRQLHSLIFPDIAFDEIFTRQSSHPLLQNFIAMMAHPLAVEANILDPDFVILGGLVPAMPDFPRAEIEEQVRMQTYYPEPSASLTLLASAIRDGDKVVAAAQYAFMNAPGR